MPFRDFSALFNSTVILYGANQALDRLQRYENLSASNCFELSNNAASTFFVTLSLRKDSRCRIVAGVNTVEGRLNYQGATFLSKTNIL